MVCIPTLAQEIFKIAYLLLASLICTVKAHFTLGQTKELWDFMTRIGQIFFISDHWLQRFPEIQANFTPQDLSYHNARWLISPQQSRHKS